MNLLRDLSILGTIFISFTLFLIGVTGPYQWKWKALLIGQFALLLFLYFLDGAPMVNLGLGR